MSQTNYGSEWDEEWDEITPSQLFENLESVENMNKNKNNKPVNNITLSHIKYIVNTHSVFYQYVGYIAFIIEIRLWQYR